MNNWEIEKTIKNALEVLYRTEKELIDERQLERCICGRLMLHLQNLLPEWNVDVEYNRAGKNRDPKLDSLGNRRMPDLVIHKRGNDGPNLAVILAKGGWNRQPRDEDKEIAEDIKKMYNYQAAFLLEIGSKKPVLTEV